MRISSTPTQFRSFSGTPVIAGINLPDFRDPLVTTRKRTGRSDEDYAKAIEEQAKKDFEAGQFQSSPGYKALRKAYVSEISPDRKGIITEGLKKVDKSVYSEEPLTLAEILFGVKFQREGKKITYIEFYDENGERVATFSNNGWTMHDTDAEAARKIGMDMIYNTAWGAAKRASQSAAQTETPAAADMPAPMLDVTA